MRVGRWTKEIDFGEGSAFSPGFPEQPQWFKDNRDFGNIENGLLDLGMNVSEVNKIMGENWYNFYAQNFKAQGG
jgi:microsomal dipeptidase-like Zn-dependent dipeptidase